MVCYDAAMDQATQSGAPLIGPDEPPPFSIVNAGGKASVMLVCDHASGCMPASLHGLGLREHDLTQHIALDKGAADVTRALAARLDASAVLAGYSRLVIDCNRRLGHQSSIVAESDGVAVPGNRGLGSAETAKRAAELFWPYHRKIGAGIAGFAQRGIRPVIISIHTFTAVMSGARRPWQIGILWDKDGRLAVPLIAAPRARGDLEVGDNEPYSGRRMFGYTIEVHAGETGLANVLVEVREDVACADPGAAAIADILAAALTPLLADPALYIYIKHSGAG